MNLPTMLEAVEVAPRITSLRSYLPIPGYGVLAVNAFVVKAKEPMLMDTGVAALSTEFMQALHKVIDPTELRWIWITHTDMDHLGNFEAVLAAAPRARVVTTFIGMAKMGLMGLPTDRAFLLNPGQTLSLGDRELLAMRPPLFDAPETTCIYESKSSTLISADCFGALLPQAVDNAADIDARTLREGSGIWASIDAPWLGVVDEEKFAKNLSRFEKLNIMTVLSSHLPAAKGMTGKLLKTLARAPRVPAFVGPDQAALEKMMAA